MASEKVTGITIIKINGVSQRSKTGAKLSLGGVKREPVYADGTLIGFTEEPVGSDLTATLAWTAQADPDAINNLIDDTVLFISDAGPIYVINGAASVEPPDITGGEISIHLMGQPAVRTQ